MKRTSRSGVAKVFAILVPSAVCYALAMSSVRASDVNVHSFPTDFTDLGARKFAEAVADGNVDRALRAAQAVPAGVNAVGNNGTTALLMAVERRDRSMVEALLTAGADPNGAPDFAPLHTAVKNEDAAVIALLIKFHADPNKTLGSKTPLAEAALIGSLDAIRMLIPAGARIDQPDRIGRSPAMIAASADSWRAVAFLLDRGASAWQDANGLTIALFAATSRVNSDSEDGTALPGVIDRLKASGFPWPPPTVAQLRAMKAAGQWPPVRH